MTTLTLLAGSNNNVIELRSLTNSATGAVDNAASVQITLQDTAGNNVSGQVWPATMAYVSSSSGIYRATLEAALDIEARRKYKAHITVTGSGAESAEWWVDCVAETRRT